jgi:dsDNA-binding SOS-regulon protein
MKKKQVHLKSGLALLGLATFFCFARSAGGQSAPDPNRPVQDNDTTRQELANFDKFLDSHREIAEQLRKNPSLVNNQEFVKNYPALQTYLQDHPAVREEIRENPNAFMEAENRYDRQVAIQDRDANRDRDPNRQTDNRARDTNRQELANFDRFLDNHRETAERLRKDPSLVDNQEFVKSHPALQTYLQDHPAVREEIKNDPNAFMQEEARYDHREDALNRDHREDGLNRDMDRDTMHRHFGEFLGDHSDIALRLSKDPSLVKNQEFIDSHPELKEYLSAHPEVKQELMANPQSFVKSSQQFTDKTATPAVQPKPKQ